MQALATRFFLGVKRCWPAGLVLLGILLMVPWLKGYLATEPTSFDDFGMTSTLGLGLLLCVVAMLVPQRWYETNEEENSRSFLLTKIVIASRLVAGAAIGFVALSAWDLVRDWIYAAPGTNREVIFALIVFALAFLAFAMFVWGEWNDTESGEKENEQL